MHVVAINTMASRARQCCLCRAVVEVKNTVHLFNTSGLEKKWPSRIFTVLGAQVHESDGISPHMCKMCTRRLESLEKAALDLEAFKDLAESSLAELK